MKSHMLNHYSFQLLHLYIDNVEDLSFLRHLRWTHLCLLSVSVGISLLHRKNPENYECLRQCFGNESRELEICKCISRHLR